MSRNIKTIYNTIKDISTLIELDNAMVCLGFYTVYNSIDEEDLLINQNVAYQYIKDDNEVLVSFSGEKEDNIFITNVEKI